MDITELLKLAYGGVNFPLYAMLSVIAFASHRVVRIPQTWGFVGVSAVAAALGGLGSYTEALATVGVTPTLLYNAAIAGAIMAAGSCMLIGAGISKGLDAAGFWPVSEDKKVNEEIRDPLSPTTPAGKDIRTPKEKVESLLPVPKP